MMAGSQEQPRLLKLISVSFKEASLDSPTFRASVNHNNILLEQTEQWTDGFLKIVKKYPSYYNEFKDFISVFEDQLAPNFLSDGIIDQDYTLSATNSTKAGLGNLWTDGLKVFCMDDNELISILSTMKTEIRNYKEQRKLFDSTQSKYDLYLSRYCGQSKNREPSALREDAFQLSDVRKSYIRVSLDLCVSIANIHKILDSNFVTLSNCLWKDIDLSKSIVNPRILFLYNQLQKVNLWSKASDLSMKMLSKDMHLAKKQIEESTIQQFIPSRDLNDHNPALINSQKLLDLKEPVYEKHGWLFMKTLVGKPSRQIWVRRWVFVKNGMLGLLTVSPTKTFVQESDKIGVLLCNVRYAPDEDRRFCFEVKTIDSTIIFQAETLNDLKYWLKVFATEKKRSLEDLDKSKLSSESFGRYPPLLSEFASTATTSTDIELTSGKVEINNLNSADGSGQKIMTSNNLSHLMNIFNKSFNPDFSDFSQENVNQIQFSAAGVFMEPILNTPISTGLTKAAIVANAFITPNPVPNAINANVWGTVNWAMYYLFPPKSQISLDNSKDVNGQLMNTQSQLSEIDKYASKIYPPYYPKNLLNADIQMRTLFESTSANPENLCVLTFRCIWSPNSKQELSGKAFLTMDHIYFYMNSMGFVSLLVKKLDDLVHVESQTKKSYNIIKVYSVEGLDLRMKIFLDDASQISEKITLLIDNKTSANPLGFKEVILKFEKIDEKYENINMKKFMASYNEGADEDGLNVNESEESLNLENPGNEKLTGGDILFTRDIENSNDRAVSNLNLSTKKNNALSNPNVKVDTVADIKNSNLNKNTMDNDTNLLVTTASSAFYSFHFISDKVSDDDFQLANIIQNNKYETAYCDEEYDIPCKALFHILFGDLSPIFKECLTMIVYGMEEGFISLPWKVTDDNNKLERKIIYQISTKSKNAILKHTNNKLIDNTYHGIVLGRMSEVHTIDKLVDNKFYNISFERSSLELPLGKPFKFKGRFILEQVSEERTRLRIYARYEFSGMSPMNFIASNAARSFFFEEVKKINQLVKEAVLRIGKHGKINTAIKLYGQLSTKTIISANDPSSKKRYNTDDEGVVNLSVIIFMKLWFKVMSIKFINAVIFFFGWLLNLFKLLMDSLSMNKTLILLLGFSVAYNVWISGRSTVSFWKERREFHKIKQANSTARNNEKGNIGSNFKNIKTSQDGVLQGAIYSKDITDMVLSGKDFSVNSSDSRCYDKFKDKAFILNYWNHNYRDSIREYADRSTYEIALKLQKSLQEIGVRRNELLIDLKILQKVEYELALGEWKNWLYSENSRCQYVKKEILKNGLLSNDDDKNRKSNNKLDEVDSKNLFDYCDSCQAELDHALSLI